ncbi:Aste57867_8826 [Aphanomyces stellatus]|uniref:Aste57867_8826 protein n=1 Tax=Aphanomyces stellatus TaxID=120398 RepID=A0A485KLA4_9STRA|nr:hypothetical protein As57867_008791 [Aphanomyces stellatus]VFT85712.1 Aste57867_8826 [Aphanomyces stellatus]
MVSSPRAGPTSLAPAAPPARKSTSRTKLQSTNHMGYFEFALCKLNGRNDTETENCFQPLAQANGDTQRTLPAYDSITFTSKWVLSKDVTSENDAYCVMRWWYTGGNNFNATRNGQEQLWNCADVYNSNNCTNGAATTVARLSALIFLCQ